LRAAHIIVDSAHTRAEILRYAPYPPDGISVVPLAVHPVFFQPALPQEWCAAHGLAGRIIILHVGSCQPRKNVETLLNALTFLNGEQAMLVQIGGRFSADQWGLIDRLHLRARVQQIEQASEADLRSAYQAAAALAFPSSYEGFGLPVLEALASGTPVVCADATSLPEVAGDAALLHDPMDAAQLAEAVRAILNNTDLANELRKRGRKRARLFTWERTARETLAVYQQVLAR
jgi:glycosyltransferase involved in cell wall biosynthesis